MQILVAGESVLENLRRRRMMDEAEMENPLEVTLLLADKPALKPLTTSQGRCSSHPSAAEILANSRQALLSLRQLIRLPGIC